MVNSLYSFRDPSCEYLNRQQYEAHQIQLIFYAGGPVQGDFRTMKRRRRRAPHWDTSFLRSWRIFGSLKEIVDPTDKMPWIKQVFFGSLAQSQDFLVWFHNNITCGRSLTNRSCFLVEKSMGQLSNDQLEELPETQ
jgi:hypothetical protein